jgi:hypothetical protein
VFYSVVYTAIATFGKFALGFWLALLLNNHFPFKSLLRAIRAGRRRHKAADPAADHAAARGTRPDLGGYLLLHAVVERVHLRASLYPEQRQQDRPRGDPDRTRFRRRLSMGALMAGSLLGSLPVAVFYSLFVDYYVSSLTGAVKE